MVQFHLQVAIRICRAPPQQFGSANCAAASLLRQLWGVHFGENSGLVTKLSQQGSPGLLCFMGDMVSNSMIHALPVSPHGYEVESSVCSHCGRFGPGTLASPMRHSLLLCWFIGSMYEHEQGPDCFPMCGRAVRRCPLWLCRRGRGCLEHQMVLARLMVQAVPAKLGRAFSRIGFGSWSVRKAYNVTRPLFPVWECSLLRFTVLSSAWHPLWVC